MAYVPRKVGRPRLGKRKLTFVYKSPPSKGSAFQPLPTPTGTPPFRLSLDEVVSPDKLAAIRKAKCLVFQTAGDTGGILDPVPQENVVRGMEADFRQDPAVDPAFFYTLGDCVYFNGDGKEYLPQFYLPYEHYEAPIVAVAGNHDGDPSPGTTSLDAFMRNFCAPKPQVTADAGDQSRDAMTQPNVFWTFVTPLCTIIGLYSNVPEHGVVHPDQQKWLLGELKGASPKMPVFVTLHHPPLSADDHHGGSGQMKQLLDQCFRDADRVPEMVLAGHVHNYQRFTRTDSKGKQTPYIVAGAGGYHNLHYVAKVNGVKPRTPITIDVEGENVTLEHFVDDRHGFLRLEVTADLITGIYYTVPRPHEPFSSPPTKADAFKLDWKSRRLL